MTAELSLSDLNGRFRYIEPPFPLPGKCVVCGNVRTPVVDFGATVDGYGALLLCERCVVQAFSLLAKIGVVEVPQSTPPEAYEKIAIDLKENLDATVLSLTSLFDGARVLGSTIADEIAQRRDEDSSAASGESSEAAAGIVGQSSDNAGDERPLGIPSSSGFERGGISGL